MGEGKEWISSIIRGLSLLIVFFLQQPCLNVKSQAEVEPLRWTDPDRQVEFVPLPPDGQEKGAGHVLRLTEAFVGEIYKNAYG